MAVFGRGGVLFDWYLVRREGEVSCIGWIFVVVDVAVAVVVLGERLVWMVRDSLPFFAGGGEGKGGGGGGTGYDFCLFPGENGKTSKSGLALNGISHCRKLRTAKEWRS